MSSGRDIRSPAVSLQDEKTILSPKQLTAGLIALGYTQMVHRRRHANKRDTETINNKI